RVHPPDEASEDAISRRVRLQNVLAAVLEFADGLQQKARLVLVFESGHPGERLAVVPHRLIAGRPFEPPKILENELALLRVAARLVTRQARRDADLRPHLVLEVIVHRPDARRPGGMRLLIAANDDRETDRG